MPFESKQSLAEVETTLEALRRQEVDAIVGTRQVLVLRLREAEQALRQQAQIIEQVHDAVITTDLEGVITHWNAGATRLYGYSAEEAHGQHLARLYFDEDLPVLNDQVIAPLQARGAHEIEVRCRRKTGEACIVHLSLSLLRNEQGIPYGMITYAVDFTERKQIETERERLLAVLAEERAQLDKLTNTLDQRVQEQTQQVRDLAAEISLVEYRERKRISQVLHDHVQQLLYGLQFLTHRVREEGEQKQVALLDQVDDLLNQAIQATRTLSVELSPPVLEREGLVAGLAWLAGKMREMHGLQVALDVQTDGEIANKHLRLLIFQIVRELLFNVVKHAQVDAAEIVLRRKDDHLLITVKDNGQGMCVDAIFVQADPKTDPQTGLGLLTIRDRMLLFGGSIELHSTPGAGTVVLLSFPLQLDVSE